MATRQQARRSAWGERLTGLPARVAAVLAAYTIYGAQQERVVRSQYGENAASFNSSPLLALLSTLFAAGAGLLLRIIFSRRRPGVALPNSGSQPPPAPRSRILSHAALGLLISLSLLTQFEALGHVSFTSLSLFRAARLVPALVLSAFVFRRNHGAREWLAAAILLFGSVVYLWSREEIPHSIPELELDLGGIDVDDWAEMLDLDRLNEEVGREANPVVGFFVLAGFLLFDSLRARCLAPLVTQSSGGELLGPGSLVLDTMLWSNVAAALFSTVLCILSQLASGGPLASLDLLLSNSSVFPEVFMLCLASVAGMLALAWVVALNPHSNSLPSKALAAQLFLGVGMNALSFDNVERIGALGWMGVGWAASAVWIMLDGAGAVGVAAPAAPAVPVPAEGTEDRKGEREKVEAGRQQSLRIKDHLTALILPPLAALVFFGLTSPQLDLGLVPPLSSTGDLVDSVEGGEWAHQMHALIDDCPPPPGSFGTHRYPNDNPSSSEMRLVPRTALVTYPRSGNSYIRSMLETASGWQTSSIYCDPALAETFLGECDRSARWLVKTHYPVISRSTDHEETYWTKWDRAVHLVRNPLDATVSYWHWAHAPRLADGSRNHSAKIEVERFGPEETEAFRILAERWQRHASYWDNAPLPTHNVRYEDLRRNPLPTLMSVLSYLLPASRLPKLAEVACSLERGANEEPYYSRKLPAFAAWEKFDVGMREMILEVTKEGWCKWGYDLLAKEAGLEGGPDCKTL